MPIENPSFGTTVRHHLANCVTLNSNRRDGFFLCTLHTHERYLYHCVCFYFQLLLGTSIFHQQHLSCISNRNFSSPEPKAPGGAYSIGRLRRPSVVRPSTISNDFSSETTGLIATKLHIQPPGTLEKKNCSNGLGH